MTTKKTSKNIWDEFIYGGHFLALGDAVALYVMAVFLNISVTWDFLVVIYLCVFAANLINRSDESEHDALTNPVRVMVMGKYVKYFYPITIVCLVVSAGLILTFSSYWALLFAVLIFVIATLYTTILKSFTKYITGFKNYIAALFYSLTVFLLAIYYKSPINLAVVLMFCFYYIRIFISSAACDIKDIEDDNSNDLKTIAINMGRKKATKLFDIINVLSGLLIVYGVYSKVLPLFSLGILLTIPYAFYYAHVESNKKNKEFFFNVIIDGEFLLWLPYLLIGKAFFN